MIARIFLKKILLITIACVTLQACVHDNSNDNTNADKSEPIIISLKTNYLLLPEQEISISTDSSVFAQYSSPTEKYTHGILGDAVEAQQLVVVKNQIFYEHNLSSQYVFEDIKPRIHDVDNDGEFEFITIRTHIDKGAGIVVYKITNDSLKEHAYLEEIGTPFRWLNIAAISDLDNNGTIEIAWIETPHIGGTLKIAPFRSGQIIPTAQAAAYSNHAIGERNLCLSVLTFNSGQKVFYVPNQDRKGITGFIYKDGQLFINEEFILDVDFSQKLELQYEFNGTTYNGTCSSS